MFVQPLNPTLLDDVNMKTTSTVLVLQSDSTLWQTYRPASSLHVPLLHEPTAQTERLLEVEINVSLNGAWGHRLLYLFSIRIIATFNSEPAQTTSVSLYRGHAGEKPLVVVKGQIQV